MIKPKDPRELAETILNRSICNVQVGAVVEDYHGIMSWGWNNPGEGFGKHAECHCLDRANPWRLHNTWCSLYVAAQRKRNSKPVLARPCEDCWLRIKRYTGITEVWYRDPSGLWVRETV